MLETSVLGFLRRKSLRKALEIERRLREAPPARARVVCIASGKGGTGKSVVATNLAVQRASNGERVLLIDFDAGLANDHLLLGLAPKFDLGHLAEGRARAQDALVEGPHGMHLISGGVGRHALANPTPRDLERLFTALKAFETSYETIIVDHGAGVGYATLVHLAAARTLLLVTSQEVTGLSDAYALYKRARMVNGDLRVGLVFNRVTDVASGESAWDRFRSACRRFLASTPELVGFVPADPAVVASVEARTPVSLLDPTSPAARALSRVAAWAPLDFPRGSDSFYERALRALR